MTDLLSDVEAPSDAELISGVRGGDVAAYGQLFMRHKHAANRLARQLVRGSDADDLVAEAFAKVLTVLQSGGGPDVAFRAYLLTAVRRLHVDRVRTAQRVQTTDDLSPFDPGVPFTDTAVAGFESGAAAKAFASLPERWQLVLWHLEVEGQKPADIAPLLGMSANSVSALAYRAREGLRQAFLTMHISDLTETDCRWVNEHLGAFVRKGLSKRDSGKVQDHLDECRRCTAMYLELTEVNDNLAGIIGPLLLGAAASGYLASTGVGSAGLLGVLSRLKDLVGANTGAASAAGVTVGIAAAAVAVFTIGTGGNHPEAKAPDVPVGVTSAAPPSGVGATPIGPSASPRITAAPRVAPTTTLSPLAPLSSPTPSLLTATAAPTDVPVSLAGTTVDDGGVHLRGTGSPLPPNVTVVLTSTSPAVSFADTGDCPVVEGGQQATCDLTPGGAGGPVPGTAIQADLTSFSAELPFNSLADEPDVDISVAFVLPAGFSLDAGTDVVTSFRHVMSQDADVALSIPDAALRPDGPGDVYRVPAALSVTGIAQNRVQDVTYTASGGSFVAGDGTLTGSTTRSRFDDLTFAVVPDDPQHPAVRISASLPAPLLDSDPSNDGAGASLSPYDVRLGDLTPVTSTADADGNQHFTATVADDGFPGGLVYTLLDDPAAPTDSGSPLEPISVDGNTVTFSVHGDVDRSVAIRAALPSGYTDADPSNNTTSAAAFTVPIVAPSDLDVALGGFGEPVHPGPDDVYSVTPSVSVTGAAADQLSAVTYDVVGGTFVDGSASTTRTVDDATPLQIVPADPENPGVRLTASVASPLVDTDPSNDSVDVPLRRYDPRVIGVEPMSEAADDQGLQEFRATVDDGGLDGVTYRLKDPAPDDALEGEPSVHGDQVEFGVRSTAETAHDITLEAVPPAGFTDADMRNNAATAQWTPPPPPLAPTTDLRLTPLTPDRPVPNEEDGFYHLATTLNVLGEAPPTATLSIGDDSDATLVSVSGCDVATDHKQATCANPVDGTRLELVLSAPTRQDTSVTITVSAPPLFTESHPDDNTASTTLLAASPHTQDVDVALSVDAGPLRPRANGSYDVPTTVTLTGPAADQVSEVTYTITGGTFVDGRTTITRPADLTTPRFQVVPEDPGKPAVAISASVPWDFTDTDTGNDTVAVALAPYDVALTHAHPVTGTADEHGVQLFEATVADDGFPGRLAYELVDTASGDTLEGRPAQEGDTVTFSVRSDGTTAHDITLRAVLPEEFTDADLFNNAATVPWTPPSTDDVSVDVPVDVQMLDLSPGVARPDRDEQYTLNGMVSVEGLGAGDLNHIVYTVSGAEFTHSGDCTASTCTMSATGSPTFRLQRLSGTGTADVTITAHVPEGFQDTDSANDTASAELKPYDVSLTGLRAETSPADKHGDQTFSAWLGSDGIDSDDVKLSFELADGPADARLTDTWAADGKVTFTVHSETDTSHPVAVRVVLPHGFEDAYPEDNTAVGASFTPRPPTANLRLSAKYAGYDKGDQHGVISVTVENAPSGVLTFALNAHQPVDLTGSPDCSLSDDPRIATCRVTESGTFATRFGIDLPPGQTVSMTVTAEDKADPDESDNTVVVGRP
jgi:RNA polymerase sigma factor (sigma-70 family)